MAYKISDVNGWGTGALGSITNPSGQINSYANVSAIETNTVTIGTPSAGIYETFAVGKEILLHVSAITSGTDYQYLGKYMVATITAVNGSVLTLSKDVSGLINSSVFANHHVQAVTIAQFDILNLSATIAPPAYSVANKYGGIIALKYKTGFNLSGSGEIDLAAKGIPIASIALRPATPQEGTAAQIAWENHITARNLYLNCPDGAAFIVGKSGINTGTATRIGGATAGAALYPYNGDSTSNAAVKGGPTILWVSETITGFDPSLIAKSSSNTSGSGLGRCYIATNTRLPTDEGLYALDCLSNPARLVGLGIKDYGTGALGTVTSLSGQINSYAGVTGISADGKTLAIGTKFEGKYEKFDAGSRVLFHVSRQTGSDQASIGKFIMAKILNAFGSTVVLDTPVTNVAPSNVLSNYKCQLVTVAQFDNLTCATNYTGAKAYNDSHGCGGLLALSVKNTFDLSNGQLNMENKGILDATRPSIAWQCCGQQNDFLPISQGHGSVFFIANNMTVNAASRIGSLTSGALYGGNEGVSPWTDVGVAGGPGTPGGAGYGAGSGAGAACGGRNGYPGKIGRFNRGWQGGASVSYPGVEAALGGLGGDLPGIAGKKGLDGVVGVGGDLGVAGASIFGVVNNLTGFMINLICTGGYPGYGGGGCGEGGYQTGGGGGGAGAPGTAFLYVNNVISADYTALLAA